MRSLKMSFPRKRESKNMDSCFRRNDKNCIFSIILHFFLVVSFFLFVQASFADEQYIAESFGLCSKGVEYYEKGELHKSKEIFERAIKLDPRNEEAQSYLELVNAELKMRARGILDSYQVPDKLVREAD